MPLKVVLKNVNTGDLYTKSSFLLSIYDGLQNMKNLTKKNIEMPLGIANHGFRTINMT